MKDRLEESQVIGTELFDEILYKSLGIHFLEPLVRVEETVKVIPAEQKEGQKQKGASNKK